MISPLSLHDALPIYRVAKSVHIPVKALGYGKHRTRIPISRGDKRIALLIKTQPPGVVVGPLQKLQPGTILFKAVHAHSKIVGLSANTAFHARITQHAPDRKSVV